MKICTPIFLFLFFYTTASSQNGLERIIVEKYYVSDLHDKTVDGDGGELPENSVTYRVYVDMLPGYIFQAAYGVAEHELRIETSTAFFNNQDRGARFPTYTRTQAQNNTVMLDSWLSAGASMKDHAGVLKGMDDGVNTIVNADGVLQNNHDEAHIPLSLEDGIIPVVMEPATVVGFFDTDLSILDDLTHTESPSIISTFDGAWASLNGSKGPDSIENIVLIGQFTTDGVFKFELNLQLRNQETLVVENYVARNPIANEILFEGLIHVDSLGLMSAIHEIRDLSNKITIYPNPTQDNFTFTIADEIDLLGENNIYTVSTLSGSPLIKGRISDKVSHVHIKSLLPGAYVLTLELHDGSRHSMPVFKIQ